MDNQKYYIQISKVAREFNTGIFSLAKLLESKGHIIKLNPTTILSQEQYDLIKMHFSNNIQKNFLSKLKNIDSIDKLKLPPPTSKPKKFKSLHELGSLKNQNTPLPKPTDLSWKIGQIKFFDQDKGFGFVECWDDGKDYFVHISKVESWPINDADYVIFRIEPSRKKPGTFESRNLSLISKFSQNPSYLKKQFLLYHNENFRKNILSSLKSIDIIHLFEKEITAFQNINSDEQFTDFKKTISFYSALNISETVKDGIESIIFTWIDQVASSKYKIKFWLEGIISDQPDNKLIQQYFESSIKAEQLAVLKRVDNLFKNELLQQFIIEGEPQDVLDFILHHLKQINELNDFDEIKSKLYDKDYWTDKKDYFLFDTAIKHMQKTIGDSQKITLFLNGYMNSISSELVLSSSFELSTDEIEKILDRNVLSKPETLNLVEKLLMKEIDFFWNSENNPYREMGYKASDSDWNKLDKNLIKTFCWIFEIAQKHLTENKFDRIESIFIKKMPNWLNVLLWEKGYLKKIPVESLSKFLLATENIQTKIDIWLNRSIITKNKILEILKLNIQNQKEIDNRREYHLLSEHILALANLGVDIIKLENIIPSNNLWFYKLTAWITGLSSEFNFDEYKTKLVFLSSDNQIKFLKKLFWLANSKKFDLTVEKLSQLTRIDFDIYSLNQEYHPDIPLDISVDIVIESIKAYSEKQKFLFDNELMKIVLKDISLNKKHKFQIHGLFERCRGRYEAKFNFTTNGKVRKTEGSWEIGFDYDSDLVDEVKNLPQRRYNPKNQHWYVPISNEEAVLAFAKEFRFFIDKVGSIYANNTHLAEFKRTSVPEGVIFCEGRKARNPHQIFNQEFWWCCNQPCFKNCEADHTDPNYKSEPEENENMDDYLPF